MQKILTYCSLKAPKSSSSSSIAIDAIVGKVGDCTIYCQSAKKLVLGIQFGGKLVG